MDNIMKRFKCFNTIMQNNTSTDDDNNDDDEEDDNSNEPDGEGDSASKTIIDTSGGNKDAGDEEKTKIEVQLPTVTKVDSTFSDSGYWKVDALEDGLDDLLKDYE